MYKFSKTIFVSNNVPQSLGLNKMFQTFIILHQYFKLKSIQYSRNY